MPVTKFGLLRNGQPNIQARTSSSWPQLRTQHLFGPRCTGTPRYSPASVTGNAWQTLNCPLRAQFRDISNATFRRHARSVSSAVAPPKQRGPIFRVLYRVLAYTGGFIIASGCLVLAFFVYDATTYREDLTYADVPVSEKALKPRRGGPKNLPIAEALVDDDDCEEMSRQKHKPKLVILGSGWGSVALLKTLSSDDYHVTVVSPVNYFLFTPMLPSATVGTLELRSLVEPIRRIVQRVKGHFLRAEAIDVELSERLLEVAQTDANGVKRHFYLPYDKLVIGVGRWACIRHGRIRLHPGRFCDKSSWCSRA